MKQLLIVIALVVEMFLVQAFWIPSPSMVHTLEVGDRVLVNKLAYKFHDVNRGDVVVFERHAHRAAGTSGHPGGHGLRDGRQPHRQRGQPGIRADRRGHDRRPCLREGAPPERHRVAVRWVAQSRSGSG